MNYLKVPFVIAYEFKTTESCRSLNKSTYIYNRAMPHSSAQ